MKKRWLALLLFCAGPAHAQFIKNTGIVIVSSADISVNSDWDNTNGSFTNNGTITTSDNWTSTGGYSQSGIGGFVLTNTATRQFNHAGQYLATLTKNGSGGNTQVNNHLIIKSKLLLQNGLLTMTGVNDTIVVLANAQVTANVSSFVVGKISRYGNGDLFFPVSAAGNYLPLTIYQVSGISGGNPRVTISVQNAPGGYSINGAANSSISFPYAWKSSVLRGDTASYVEVQYPTSLPVSSSPIVTRSVDPTHYGSMGLQSVVTSGGTTKLKSLLNGLRGLFSVAQTSVAAPVAALATSVAQTVFTANWNAVSGATSYQLDVSADNFATFVTGFSGLTVTGTSTTVSGLINNTAYKYRVRAAIGASVSVNSNVIDVVTISKATQTISFAAISDRTLGDTPFALSGTSNSGLAVNFATTSDKIAISGTQVSILKVGRVVITGSQPGNASFNAAASVDQSFCVKPVKPTVALSANNTETPILTSNAAAGNQWYLNGSAISGATNATFNVATAGIYKVQVKADDCPSEFSADFPIIVTGDLSKESSTVRVYPNPAEDYIEIQGLQGPLATSQIFDVTGRSNVIVLEASEGFYRGSVQHLSPGVYLLRISEDAVVHQVKFIKK